MPVLKGASGDSGEEERVISEVADAQAEAEKINFVQFFATG